MKLAFMVTSAAFITLASPVYAQHSGHSVPNQAAPAAKQSVADSASTKAHKAANVDMHKGMDIAYTGDADIDFIKGMIPHHQGAIDMARVVITHGKDPATRKLAEAIIAAQEKEITFMKDWLKQKGQ